MGILLSFVLLMCLTVPAQSGHSQGNGTCRDDIIHYNNMKHKRTDAPLYALSKENYEKGIAKRMSNRQAECEVFIEEALRLIRRDSEGNYPTE